MLKKSLAVLLVLAGLATSTEITFTDDPLLIDDGGNDEDLAYGVLLPNPGCRVMAEFLDGDYEGDVMVIDLHSRRQEGSNVIGSQVWFNIWETGDEWMNEDFTYTGEGNTFLSDYPGAWPASYSQLANAAIYSSSDGVIHLGKWTYQVYHNYSRYQDSGTGYSWRGYSTESDSFWSAFYFTEPDNKRFGQVLQPAFYVNEYHPTPMSSSVEPTFVLNGHDCETATFKAGFYVQTLTDPDYEDTWNDPIVLTPQTFGNMGFSSVTGDPYGKLHIFWESSINTGLGNPKWHSMGIAICQNELYYTNMSNGQFGQIVQLTDNYEDSEGEEYLGNNIISSDVDPSGNVWALYEIVNSVTPSYGYLLISIGIVKISPAGSILYGPATLISYDPNYIYISPQIHIDEDGIAHCIYIRKNRSTTYYDRELMYANFDTQSLQITLNDTTDVSDDMNYHLGVGHIFVDSAKRIHFLWANIDDSETYPSIYYRRSEDFCDKNMVSDRATSVCSVAVESGPVEFRVNDAFPNPASDAITFSYSLPQAERVTLRVYDLAGRLVAVPIDETQSIGQHIFEWNVGDCTNLANGLYLYTLQAGDHVQTKRLVISR